MRVLITGSSGMIGTNLGLELQRRGEQVHGLDCRPNCWSGRIETTSLDLRAPHALTDFGWRADVIVHLAAHAKVHASVENPQLAFDNISMAHTVLEYCRMNRCALLIGSSREVYGNGETAVTGERAVLVDRTASPYSASKLAVEALAHSYRRCYGLPITILRFSNVYGRFDCDLARMERVVPLFIRRIAESLPVTIFGAAKLLDFTYIDDCIQGLSEAVRAMGEGRLNGEVINIASGRGFTLKDLAGCIGSALGKEPLIEYSDTRPGEIVRYVADLQSARRQLNYSPRVFLPEGVRRAVEWQSTTGTLPAHV